LAPGKRWIMRRIPVPFQRGLLCGRADALAIGKTCVFGLVHLHLTH
jgi:hypothetical protein